MRIKSLLQLQDQNLNTKLSSLLLLVQLEPASLIYVLQDALFYELVQKGVEQSQMQLKKLIF